jgi:hypothetical protein
VTAVPWLRRSSRKAGAPNAAASSPAARPASSTTTPTAGSSTSARITGRNEPATQLFAFRVEDVVWSPASGSETWGFGRRDVRGDPCGDPPLRTAGRLRALLAARDAR